jgi:hypothetical protein
MNRIRGIQDGEADARTREIFERIKRRLGRLTTSARIRAYDFELLRISEEMSAHTAETTAAAPKLKELAQLKVAAMVGCPF